MNFKNSLILLIVVSIMGCSDYINGSKKEEKVLKLNQDRFACLNNVPQTFRNMLTEDSTAEKMNDSIQCLENSLAYFKKRTKGTVGDGYSVQDLRSFFGHYLGDTDRITDEMAVQMMKVKRALFGGNEKIIQKTELQALIDLLESLRQEIGVLKPLWDVILVKDSTAASHDVILKAHQLLNDSLTKLVLNTNLYQSDYSFDEFKSLMNETEKFIQRAPKQKEFRFIRWFSIIEGVKLHLFGENTDMSSAVKWRQAVSMVLEIHKIYSLYTYQYKGHSLYTPEALSAGDEIIYDAINLLDHSWCMDRDGIKFEDTRKLLVALEDKKILPDNLSAKALFEFYQTMVQKFLNQNSEKQQVKLSTLGRNEVNSLKSEYRNFKGIQNFINSLPLNRNYSDLVAALNRTDQVQVKEFPEIAEENLQLSWRDWKSHLIQQFPLAYLPDGSLVLDRNVKSIDVWNWNTLSRLNVMKFASRILMVSFGVNQTLDLEQNYLIESSMTDFYSGFWNIGIELQAFDERSGNSGKRTYFEGDHFLYSSDGDGQVHLQESFELINVIFSAGLSGLKRMQDDLQTSSCILPELDFYGKHWLQEDCFKKLLRKNFSFYFSNLSGFANWVSGLNDQQWEEFYKDLIAFSRYRQNTVGKIETGDLRTLIVILHYVEGMYLKFDTNGDDRLSTDELIAGSTRFVPFFSSLYKLEPKGPLFRGLQQKAIDYAVSHAFACIVMSGQMPTFSGCTEEFLKQASAQRPYSNRGLILKTLSTFRASLK
jgi:hypothetical protein